MPNVGGKKFGYSPAGRRAAKKYARETGQPMKSRGGYGQGVDRRGGARTGMLSKASRSPGMGSRFGNKPSPFGNRRGRPGGGAPSPQGINYGSIGRVTNINDTTGGRGRRPGSRPKPRFGMNSGPGMGKRRGY